ncbi:MAG: MoxR family ATPase [Actinobacteria bacterium]|nr:MoxR family ATPase [Actinomycetota bacterium]
MESEVDQFQKAFRRIAANVNLVIHGKADVVRMALVAVFADGHVLFEDVPGLGKSMLARALSNSMGALSARVQCTPDMLPGDITGSSIIDMKTMQLQFKPGPVFTNILLVDEINRATPKTQSALLECMAERTVSVDGKSNALPKPFLVLATQNPVEQAGTFPLPEAQLDRFLFKLKMGYPDEDSELLVMRGNAAGLEVDNIKAVTSAKEITAMQQLVTHVVIPEAVERYILQIVASTRTDPSILLGASPRASITLSKAARVMAASDGRWTVYPEDVRALLGPVLAHRIMLSPEAVLRGESVEDVLERVTNRVRAPLGVGNAAPENPGAAGSAKTGNGTPTKRPTTKRPGRRAKAAAS